MFALEVRSMYVHCGPLSPFNPTPLHHARPTSSPTQPALVEYQKNRRMFDQAMIGGSTWGELALGMRMRSFHPLILLFALLTEFTKSWMLWEVEIQTQGLDTRI